MTKLGTFAFVLAASICASAHAAPQRTFVSSTGSDSNPCSVAQPCRTFAPALSTVIDGGQVIVLDSAGYGTISISKWVTITAPPGVYAGISAGGTAIDITAPFGEGEVVLRGLTLLYNGPPFPMLQGIGVDNESGVALVIENCTINGFEFNVLHVGPGALHIRDSELRRGVNKIDGSSMALAFTIERTLFTPGPGLQPALTVSGDARGAIRDSSFVDGGGLTGIHATTGNSNGKPVEVLVENVLFQNLQYGVYSDAQFGSNATVTVSGSQFMENQVGAATHGGGTISLVSNRFAGNAIGVQILATGGAINTDGRNWFGNNGADLGPSTTLTGPSGIK